MKSKRILSALLAALMLSSSLVSCATTGNSDDPSISSTTATVTEEDTGLRDNLPDDLDFEEEEITFLSNTRPETLAEIAVEKVMGEPVNDAVFERNMTVENRLGIKIVSLEVTGGAVDKVATAVKANSGEYDAMAAECYITLPKTLEGVFANLNDTEYLDLKQPYWSQGLNESVSHQEAQYVAAGSMLLSMYRFGFVTVFNKRIFTDASQPFLYEHVENDTWTLDQQIKLIPIFHRDNGNGIQDATGDVYGLISTDSTNIDAYWSSCQLPIIGKNEDNEYEFIFDSALMVEVADKLIQLYHDTDSGMYNFHLDTDWANIRQVFADGYAAMATFRLLELENEVMRNMVDEFGVVPMPKYSEAQNGYQTLLHDQFTVVAIPTTVSGDRLDMVSATLEALSSAGYRIVKPVYYEETLRTKIAQDPQSAEMMDIIVEGIYIDAGIIYVAALDYFHQELRVIVRNGRNDTASRFKGKSKAAIKTIDRINKDLNKIATNAG